MIFFLVLRQIVLACITFLGVCLLIFTLTKFANINILENLLLGYYASESQGWLSEFSLYLNNVINGNWGISMISHQLILDECLALLPATLELMVLSSTFAIAAGLTLGMYAGIYAGSWFDRAILSLSFIGYSMPIFWLGLLAILTLSLNVGLTPVSGRIGFLFDIEPITGFIIADVFLNDLPNYAEALSSVFRHLILPLAVLSAVPLCVITRMMRNATIEVQKSDYIQAGFAKGLSQFKIIWVHTLRNALLIVMPTIALQVGALVMGALVVETIFSWPGLGKWLIESVNRRDFPAIHGAVIVLVLVIIVTNSLIDLLSKLLNPKSRRESHGF